MTGENVMSDQPDLPKDAAIEIVVDSPLRIVISPEGEMKIVCYQRVWGRTEALSMHLNFTRDAAGSLAGGLHRLITEGHITLHAEQQPPKQ